MDTAPRPGVFARIGRAITKLRIFLSNLLFVLVLVLLVGWLLSPADEGLRIPDGAALVVEMDGPIVEQAPPLDPMDLLLNGDAPRPLALRDLDRALELAAADDRIAALVLDLDGFVGAAPGTLRAVGRRLDEFKASGKPLIVAGDSYSQSAYYLASHADQLYMNPMGQVLLTGLGIHPAYFADALDRLRVNVHVFRVGAYKDAVEPFVRNDMSEASRTSNQALLETLWADLRGTIARNRRMAPEVLDGIIERTPELLEVTGGDLARLALENGLVDELLDRDQARERIAGIVGREDDGPGYRQVTLPHYLSHSRLQDIADAELPGRQRVGIVVAEGTIVADEGDDPTVVGDHTARLIRQARENNDIKALVLRVNSPGGSAFASEVIRKELELAQVMGKPVVVSMGGMAASGGYWISATADRIYAESETLTGSIGIFGLLPTFEDSASALGVSSDGVGTHSLSGATNPLLPINPGFAAIIQANLEHGYRQFLNIVARGRDMTPEAVDEVAQGRVWPGSTALELGLVDELGGLDLAVAKAAELAGLEAWDVNYIEMPKSPQQMFLENLIANRVSLGAARLVMGAADTPVNRALSWLQEPMRVLRMLDDPANLYALCASCSGLMD